MASVFTSGWEGSGVLDSSAWTAEEGSGCLSVSTSQHFQGAQSLQYSGGNADSIYKSITAISTCAIRFALRVSAYANEAYCAVLRNNVSFGNLVYVYVTSTGGIKVSHNSTGGMVQIGSTYAASGSTWYQVEVKWVSGTSVAWKIWDSAGTTELANGSTTANVRSYNIDRVFAANIGAPGGTQTYQVDSYEVDNADYVGPIVAGYTLTAEKGTFTETGNAAGLRAARKMSAAQGAFTWSGLSVNLRRGYTIAAVKGTYTETGQAALLTVQRRMPCVISPFAWAGFAANLKAQRRMAAVISPFAWVGLTANLRTARRIAAVLGVFTETGWPALLTAQRRMPCVISPFVEVGWAAGLTAQRRMAAVTGAFTFTGNAATLTYTPVGVQHYTITVETGAFVYVGQVVALRAARQMTAATGPFVEVGWAVGLVAARRMTAVTGAFTFTGNAATLTYAPVGAAYTLTAVTSTFAEAGWPAGLRAARQLPTTVGVFAEAGWPALLTAQRRMAAALGTYSFVGRDANLVKTGSYILTAGMGAFAEAGWAAGLRVARHCDAAAGSFTLTGYPAVLFRGRTLAAAAGAFVEAGWPAGLRAGRSLAAGLAVYDVLGWPADLSKYPPDYIPPQDNRILGLLHCGRTALPSAGGREVVLDKQMRTHYVNR